MQNDSYLVPLGGLNTEMNGDAVVVVVVCCFVLFLPWWEIVVNTDLSFRTETMRRCSPHHPKVSC